MRLNDEKIIENLSTMQRSEIVDRFSEILIGGKYGS